jgi:hypothetical protein
LTTSSPTSSSRSSNRPPSRTKRVRRPTPRRRVLQLARRLRHSLALCRVAKCAQMHRGRPRGCDGLICVVMSWTWRRRGKDVKISSDPEYKLGCTRHSKCAPLCPEAAVEKPRKARKASNANRSFKLEPVICCWIWDIVWASVSAVALRLPLMTLLAQHDGPRLAQLHGSSQTYLRAGPPKAAVSLSIVILISCFVTLVIYTAGQNSPKLSEPSS